jgi:hypothetical protein
MDARHRNAMLVYRSRSVALLRTMGMCSQEYLGNEFEEFALSVPVLAVHAAIALVDAILIACTGARSKQQDHRAATARLEKLCNSRRISKEGIRHFVWLIQRKSRFAYGDQRLAAKGDIEESRKHADRFAVWAYENFPEIGAEESDA